MANELVSPVVVPGVPNVNPPAGPAAAPAPVGATPSEDAATKAVPLPSAATVSPHAGAGISSRELAGALAGLVGPVQAQALVLALGQLAQQAASAPFLDRPTADRLLRLKKAALKNILAADAKTPGMLEQTLGTIFDRMAPAEQRAQKPMLVAMAAEAVRAEAWVVSLPNYGGWHALADEIDAAVAKFLPQPPKDLDDPALLSAIEQACATTFVGGNKIESLKDGPAFYASLLDFVQRAPGPLFINYWAIYDDVSGKAVAEALAARHRAGTPVFVMVDGKVAARPHHGGALALPILESAGVPVLRWSDPAEPPAGSHTKLVTNGTTSIAGGSNAGDPYTHQDPTKPGWTDSNLRFTGPISHDHAAYFVSRWNAAVRALGLGLPPIDLAALGVRGPAAAAGTDSDAFIAQDPGNDHRILVALALAARGTKERVRIQNAYFILTPPIERMVRELLSRDIAIDLFTNSFASVDEPAVARPIVASARRLLEIAAELGKSHLVNVYLKEGSTLHAKRMIFDKRVTASKSYNVHQRSEWLEHEQLDLVRSERLAAEQAGLFDLEAKRDGKRYTRAEDIVVPPPGPYDFVLGALHNQL